MADIPTEEQLTVQVEYTTRCRYVGDVKMTRAEWDAFNKRLDDAGAKGYAEKSRVEFAIFEDLGFKLGEPTDEDDPELDTFEDVTENPDEPEEPAVYGFTR